MKITVNRQNLAITDATLTVSKSVNIYEAEFSFSSDWDGFNKTAVFQLNGGTAIEVVLVDDIAIVPHEALVNYGTLVIGVYGTKDEKVMPTIWGKAVRVRLGTPTGSIGTEPTPSIYAQILEVANSAKDIADEAYEKAETAQDSAKSYAEESEAWAVGQRDGEDVPSTDETYHNNSKFWAEMAEQGAEDSGYAWFEVDESDGEMYVTITANLDSEVSFEVNEITGELEVVIV